MATKPKAVLTAPSPSFGISIAAALLLTPDECADEFAARANVRRLCFQDQGKLIYGMNEIGLPAGETVYSLLRKRGVNDSSIQNAKRAADVIAELVGTKLLTEQQLDAVLTHRFAVDYKRCISGKVTAEAIAEIVKLPNAAEEIECLAANGKTLAEMQADVKAKADASAAKIVADATAATEAANAAAATAAKAETDKADAKTAKAAAETAAANATTAKAAAAAEKVEAEKATATATTAKATAAAAKAEAEKATAAAVTVKAEAEKATATATTAKAEAEKSNAAAEKRLAELATAEKKAVAALMSGRDGKLLSPTEIITRLTEAIAACFELPAKELKGVPNLLLTAAEEIESHLAAATVKAA